VHAIAYIFKNIIDWSVVLHT